MPTPNLGFACIGPQRGRTGNRPRTTLVGVNSSSFCRFTLLSSVSAMVQGRLSVKVRVGVWPCLCEPQGTETLWGSRPCSDVPWPACRRLVKFSRLEEPRRTPTVGLCKNDCTDALIDQPGPEHRSLARLTRCFSPRSWSGQVNGSAAGPRARRLSPADGVGGRRSPS